MELLNVLKKEEGWEKDLSRCFNNLSFRADKELEKIMKDTEAAESLEKIAAVWLHILCMKKENGDYDGRNKRSVETGVLISHTDAGKCIMKGYEDAPLKYKRYTSQFHPNSPGDGYDIAFRMAMDHKTIQQTFSSFIFEFLKRTTKIDLEMEPGWERMPLI